jgi:hypothetical protein
MQEALVRFNTVTAAKLQLVRAMRNERFAKAGLTPPDEAMSIVMALEVGLDFIIRQNVVPSIMEPLPHPGLYHPIVPIAVGPQADGGEMPPAYGGPKPVLYCEDRHLGMMEGLHSWMPAMRLTFQPTQNGEEEAMGFVEEKRNNRYTKRPRVWNQAEVQVLTRLFQSEQVESPTPPPPASSP